MTKSIKPIETKHNGYLFRSRLEARWAIFFETIGVEYYYEMEGYDLGNNMWYLPDFYIPKWDCFVEIKSAHIWQDIENVEAATTEQLAALNDSVIKPMGLAHKTQKRVIVLYGGFGSSDEVYTMVYFMNDYTKRYPYYAFLAGFSVFGSCQKADCLYLRAPDKTEDYKIEPFPEDASDIDLYDSKLCEGFISDHLVILNRSIGFNFAVRKRLLDSRKFLIPYTAPLFSSYNALFANRFKPHVEAYKTAKQARF